MDVCDPRLHAIVQLPGVLREFVPGVTQLQLGSLALSDFALQLLAAESSFFGGKFGAASWRFLDKFGFLKAMEKDDANERSDGVCKDQRDFRWPIRTPGMDGRGEKVVPKSDSSGCGDHLEFRRPRSHALAKSGGR